LHHAQELFFAIIAGIFALAIVKVLRVNTVVGVAFDWRFRANIFAYIVPTWWNTDWCSAPVEWTIICDGVQRVQRKFPMRMDSFDSLLATTEIRVEIFIAKRCFVW
jgi:hypothetical protein